MGVELRMALDRGTILTCSITVSEEYQRVKDSPDQLFVTAEIYNHWNIYAVYYSSKDDAFRRWSRTRPNWAAINSPIGTLGPGYWRDSWWYFVPYWGEGVTEFMLEFGDTL